MLQNNSVRNIAIIAHVDHGKTTLVDQMLKQSGSMRVREDTPDRVMDSMDLERERGITIAAKNCAVYYNNVKINILDTPGHADFGGEVERALSMVDGAILLVDSAEGTLPQTRFVLKKALDNKLPIVVVVNKIDRKDARPKEVLDQVINLFIDLDAEESQLDFPVLYAIGRDGVASNSLEVSGSDLKPLFAAIVEKITPPCYQEEQPLQLLVSSLAYSEHVGRLAIGKVKNGVLKKNEQLVCIGKDGKPRSFRPLKLQIYDGVSFRDVEQVESGDIGIIVGVEGIELGDTVCLAQAPKALKRISVDDPTISMRFFSNTSPISGREGKIFHPQKIGERLRRESLQNIALQVESVAGEESYVVKGRGEFQMAILIEQMRREGFELTVGRPEILFKEENGRKLEPIEHVFIDVDDAYVGAVTSKLSIRKGKLVNLVSHGTGRTRLEFSIPSRGLIGYRTEFLTDTRGTGIMNSLLSGYEEYRGDFINRVNGSLVADREGTSVPYALFHLEPRGIMFIGPGEAVYSGMVIGEHNRENDLYVNPTKEKKLTNIRAAGKDENVVLTPVAPITLEKAIEFIRDDELVEVTPKSIRIRKAFLPAARGN